MQIIRSSTPKLSRGWYVPVLALFLVSCAGVGLVIARTLTARNLDYLFLIWNLILAWMPLLLALELHRRYQIGAHTRWTFWALACAWLLFFPNAPYIFTDLIHLNNWFRNHYWIDFSLILLFAMIGFMLAFMSLYLVQSAVAHRFGKPLGWLFCMAIMGLAGVGVYIGRFLRLNSWDFLLALFAVRHDLHLFARHPLAYKHVIAFPVLFGGFLFLCYVMLYALTHMQPEQREHPTAA